MATQPALIKPRGSWLRRFFAREDPVYDNYASRYQAKSFREKVGYLILYLVPGILAYVLINVEPVFRAELYLTGLSPRSLQYVGFLIVTFIWHMFLPLLILRWADRLTLRQSFEFLGFNRIDGRGLILLLPVYCAAFALLSLPYMTFIWRPLFYWLQALPAFQLPSYSAFQGPDNPNSFYRFSPFALSFLFIGNFLGEELYFRGYLMKKRPSWDVRIGS